MFCNLNTLFTIFKIIVFVSTLTQYINGNEEKNNVQRICPSMHSYIYDNKLSIANVKPYYDRLVRGRSWKNKTLTEQVNERYATKKANQLMVLDYKSLNETLIKTNYHPTKMDCDMIRPPLPVLIENTQLCKSMGQYLLQFGFDVYLKFYNERAKKINEDTTQENNSTLSKIAKKIYENLSNRENKSEGNKKLSPIIYTAISRSINRYYAANYWAIFTDYNTFYDSYTMEKVEQNDKPTKSHKKDTHCDYFKRLKPSNDPNVNDKKSKTEAEIESETEPEEKSKNKPPKKK